jgi:predicted kinase
VVFDVPLEACYQQARTRSRVVASDVIQRQHALFQQVKLELEGEGYAGIVHLRPEIISGHSPEAGR